MTLTIILPSGEFLYHGKQVTFKSPCDSEGLTGLIVDGVTYDVVNAMGTQLVGNSFDVGAMVSVIFDMNDNKAYVQNADTNAYLENKFKEKLDKSGGTMTGHLTLSDDPTQNMHAATKKYVDEHGYSHPSTHPVSMITGLEEAVDGFGYSKVVYGSYVGNARNGTQNNGYDYRQFQTITLPIAINHIVMLFDSTGVLQYSTAVGKSYAKDNTGYCPLDVDSSGVSFTVSAKGATSSTYTDGTNGSGKTWYYLAF